MRSLESCKRTLRAQMPPPSKLALLSSMTCASDDALHASFNENYNTY